MQEFGNACARVEPLQAFDSVAASSLLNSADSSLLFKPACKNEMAALRGKSQRRTSKLGSSCGCSVGMSETRVLLLLTLVSWTLG